MVSDPKWLVSSRVVLVGLLVYLVHPVWYDWFSHWANSQITFVIRYGLAAAILVILTLIGTRRWLSRPGAPLLKLDIFGDQQSREPQRANQLVSVASVAAFATLALCAIAIYDNIPALKPRAGAPVAPKPADDPRPVLVLIPKAPPPAPLPRGGHVVRPAPLPQPENPPLEALFRVAVGVTAPSLPPGLMVGLEDGDVDSNDPPPPPRPVATTLQAPRNLRLIGGSFDVTPPQNVRIAAP